MIRFLLISSFSVLLFSCKPYEITNAVKKETSIKEFQNQYFANPEMDYVYKAHIDVYGNELSGIFIAKRINDSIHRVVFTTDFGNKLLDFELSETDFKVNYIMEDLDKKMVVNTLRDDFRLLLRVDYSIVESLDNEEYYIYKSADKKRFNYFFVNKTDGKLVKLINASKCKEKVVFEFASENSTFAENITILHKNIKLKIELNQISNQSN